MQNSLRLLSQRTKVRCKEYHYEWYPRELLMENVAGLVIECDAAHKMDKAELLLKKEDKLAQEGPKPDKNWGVVTEPKPDRLLYTSIPSNW
ncbi:hypothetical protein PG997_014878 [Apiospora hydei]|uniref:Uncharacterized protein n=1 Tax=Apiospora hydei TaxID=1337664 RepID=A0ABR1UXK8_9PEZI